MKMSTKQEHALRRLLEVAEALAGSQDTEARRRAVFRWADEVRVLFHLPESTYMEGENR